MRRLSSALRMCFSAESWATPLSCAVLVARSIRCWRRRLVALDLVEAQLVIAVAREVSMACSEFGVGVILGGIVRVIGSRIPF